MFSIIVAVAKNNAIGCHNKLLWHISEDLKRFKEITTGHTIIMGRKTFESLPKVLPNRKHIVITRNMNFNSEDERVTVIHSIDDILTYADEEEEYFIIGGEEIYRQFLPLSQKIYLTIVNKDFEADAFFPDINYSEWTVTDKSPEKTDDEKLFSYTFISLKRLEKKP